MAIIIILRHVIWPKVLEVRQIDNLIQTDRQIKTDRQTDQLHGCAPTPLQMSGQPDGFSGEAAPQWEDKVIEWLADMIITTFWVQHAFKWIISISLAVPLKA